MGSSIHAYHVALAIVAAPDTGAAALAECGVCPCAAEWVLETLGPDGLAAFLAGVQTARYVQPLVGASRAEMEYIAACIKLANEVVPGGVSGDGAIITDGILGRIQMGVDRNA